jgi:hypothetical protein
VEPERATGVARNIRLTVCWPGVFAGSLRQQIIPPRIESLAG